MRKVCKICLLEKSFDNFYKKPDMADGHSNICRDCRTIEQRAYRAMVGNVVTHKYEKTKSGFLVRLYRNMLSRVSGVQREKYYLYEGLGILDKQSFYEWASKQDKFHSLFEAWVNGGFERRLTPSVDRVNSGLGYDIENMEWVTMSENSSRGAKSKKINGRRKPQLL